MFGDSAGGVSVKLFVKGNVSVNIPDDLTTLQLRVQSFSIVYVCLRGESYTLVTNLWFAAVGKNEG